MPVNGGFTREKQQISHMLLVKNEKTHSPKLTKMCS